MAGVLAASMLEGITRFWAALFGCIGYLRTVLTALTALHCIKCATHTCSVCMHPKHHLPTSTQSQGVGGGVEAARAGHEVVMCPTAHCYFDYKQAAEEKEPGAWYAMLPLSVRWKF